ncbi:hypothetical protein [Phenylobacterium sp.]|uniref:hypothetical protein n=1 Tax=Phenylobacterium sp. TaxID=1871053 RepID=UPI0025F0B5F1|nr:hypothetical protein [Phenylobacterium sp.]MCA6343734.1 hypothetical protein [Phenylobacterium sp.]
MGDHGGHVARREQLAGPLGLNVLAHGGQPVQQGQGPVMLKAGLSHKQIDLEIRGLRQRKPGGALQGLGGLIHPIDPDQGDGAVDVVHPVQLTLAAHIPIDPGRRLEVPLDEKRPKECVERRARKPILLKSPMRKEQLVRRLSHPAKDNRKIVRGVRAAPVRKRPQMRDHIGPALFLDSFADIHGGFRRC